MKLFFITLIAFMIIANCHGGKITATSQKKGIPNKVFVQDKKLLQNKNTRDFSGGVRYGSFLYNGPCPDPNGGLTDIFVVEAATSLTPGNCFTDSSVTPISENIGFICQPGSPSIIHFGSPGSNGFVIGGDNFAGTGAAKAGFRWGQIGQPNYTPGTATTGCSDSCTSTYCTGTCTASCTANNEISTGENCADAGTGTSFFIPDNGFEPSNCGSLGDCCDTFSFPAAPPPSCIPTNFFDGFESGSFDPTWTVSASGVTGVALSGFAHSGNYEAGVNNAGTTGTLCTTFSVCPSITYSISFWTDQCEADANSILRFEVDGNIVVDVPITQLSGQCTGYNQFTGTYTPITATTSQFCIVFRNDNDFFYLDDISFTVNKKKISSSHSDNVHSSPTPRTRVISPKQPTTTPRPRSIPPKPRH